jgi:hypothetical protein
MSNNRTDVTGEPCGLRVLAVIRAGVGIPRAYIDHVLTAPPRVESQFRGDVARGSSPKRTYQRAVSRRRDLATSVDLDVELSELRRIHDEVDAGDLDPVDREHEGGAHLTADHPYRTGLAVDECR